jgi:phage major head subunit gpT-like protein
MSLSGILGNTANKFLLMGFNAVESTWREIAAIRSVRDFKQVTSYRLTGGFTYDKVGPAGELKHATIDEMSYTNQAETYGKMFAITRTAIINDDLGALTDVPVKLGRGAALKLNNVFWATFLNNSTFFTIARGNAIEGVTVGVNDSRLNIEGLTRAETAFFNLTDPDGDPVAVQPTLLLVPNALNATAASLMASTEYRDTTTNTVFGVANPHAGKYRVVRSSYLSNPAYTGYSTTAWYILANPAELAVIEVAFLNGRQEPVVESADADFNVLGIQMRGYHDFGVSLQEWRAGVRAKGAA